MSEQQKFFDEVKDVTDQTIAILRTHGAVKTADKLLIMMGRMEGVIKYFDLDQTKVAKSSFAENTAEGHEL